MYDVWENSDDSHFIDHECIKAFMLHFFEPEYGTGHPTHGLVGYVGSWLWVVVGCRYIISAVHACMITIDSKSHHFWDDESQTSTSSSSAATSDNKVLSACRRRTALATTGKSLVSKSVADPTAS